MAGLYCYQHEGAPIAERGARTLVAAKRRIKEFAMSGKTGRYWVEQNDVPLYGVMAWDEPKTERVKTEPRPHPTIPGGMYGGGFTTRTVPGQVQRRLKAGNMPWNR